MKRIFLLSCLFLLFYNSANATLITIGTADYDADGNGAIDADESYNLIWDYYNNGNSVVWLDYTKGQNKWGNIDSWASGIVLTDIQTPGYTISWDDKTWRLPTTVDKPIDTWGYDGTTTSGYNITSSEMGHLYYTEFGNLGFIDTEGNNHQPGWGLNNTGDFNNIVPSWYWSGTEVGSNTNYAWHFQMKNGNQNDCDDKDFSYYGLAVRTGQVSTISPVPEPSIIATPTFSPVPGTYNSPQTITISCSTEGAVIHYTDDGTEPTENSPEYSSPIEIPMDTTKTIKAVAFKTDWVLSNVLEGTYSIITLPATPVPDTGQTQSYTDTFGEDSDYLINPPSYTKLDASDNDLADSATSWTMVRDNVTGLIWEVKTDDGSVHDKDNTYTWYDSNPDTNGGNAGTPGDGTDTEDFINALNSSNYGGHFDWRLPTEEELLSIADYGTYYPAINDNYFPNNVSSHYWSSTTYSYNTGNAWNVEFYYGYGNDFHKSHAFYVRAVRGGQSGSLDKLVLNNDNTVTDTNTGLIWQKDGSTGKMNWENAISYCENLKEAGYSDWRMPTAKELASIVKLDTYNPSIDTNYFTAVSSYYWSSTTDSSDGYAWCVGFDYGYVSRDLGKSDTYYVRAVRNIKDPSGQVAAPTFSIAPGIYNSPQNLSISCSTEGATIHYTEDETEPTEASPVYNSPIELSMNTTKTIKARAFKEDWTASDVLKGIYTITSVQENGTLTISLKEGTEPEYYEAGNTVGLKAIYKNTDGNPSDVSIFLTWASSDFEIAEVSSSGLVTFKANGSVTITATGGGLFAQKNFQVGVPQEITKHHGNLIIVAGGSLSETDTLKNAIQYLSNRMYRVFKMRGFEDEDIYYINPKLVQDLDGNGQNDGIVDSSDATVAQLQYAINWAASQPNDGPLYIYLMDHGGNQTFRIGPLAILTAAQLDSYLDVFESETLRDSIVMVEACHSGTFVEPLTDSDRLVITSTDSKAAYISLQGDTSFSQILSTNFLKGMSWVEAFEDAKTQLTQMGMPYNIQKPQINTGQGIVASYVGGEFALADFLPFISDYTKSKSVTADIDHEFLVVVDTLDISGLNAWATVTPPLYQPPKVTKDFETPSLGLDTFDFTNQSGTFKGTYSFTYNGTHKLVYYVKDKNNNVVSTPPVEIIVTGGTDPSYQNSIGANWNLLSLPLVPNDSSIDTVLTDIMDNIYSAWKWDTGNWAVWIPESVMSSEDLNNYIENKGFSLLEDINCGEGFWVNSSTNQSLSVSGTQPSDTSSSLTEGWNLVGLKGNQAKSITDFVSGNEAKIDSIWKWKDGAWAVYLPGEDDGGGAYAESKGFTLLDNINPGEGFWMSCTENITITLD